MSPFSLNTERITDAFKNHLEIESNKRIIFSGIFGIGKTHFLREFFASRPEFVAVHLMPVNYSVSKNEDIFELIKYDIFYQLLKEKIYLEKVAPSDLHAIAFLRHTDVKHVIEPFIQLIPKIGGLLDMLNEPLNGLNELLLKKKKQIETDEGKAVADFANRIHNAVGNIYENDIYTQLITTLVERAKEGAKKVILIIDDLDRIDPDHILEF